MKIMRTIGKGLLFLFTNIVVVLLIVIIFFWFKSSGKTDLIKDANGNIPAKSIARIEKINLRGTEQYLVIRGIDSTKPLMLYLHGGPGGPEVALIKEANKDIEKDFLMVYWEQYGAGKSYSKHMLPERFTLEQFVLDTRELSEMLLKRFNKRKIFLMGHSWGSLLGMQTIYQYPQLYYAYFGMGQLCNQFEGELLSYNWVKKQAETRKDTEAMETMSHLLFPNTKTDMEAWKQYIPIERKYVLRFGGGIEHATTSSWPIIKTLLLTSEYSLKEKLNAMKASQYSTEHLWHDIINRNLFNEIDSVQVPAYILQGVHDFQTPYSLAKDFFRQLKAPQKAFFTFYNSAHSPIIEETEKFNQIVREKASMYDY